MTDLRVKNNKIKTKPTPKKALVFILALGILGLAAIAFFSYLPRMLKTDIYFKYGADTYKTTANATIEKAFAQINDGSIAPGNLVSVAGSIIETGTGSPIVYSINGEVVAPETYLHNGDVVDATSGQNITEKTKTKTVEGHVSFERRGSGPVVAVITPGKNSLTQIVKGEKSGQVKSTKVVQKPVAPVVEYKHYRNNKDKVVALTFDDGPSKEYTPQVLRVLKKYKAKATFFEVGHEIKKHPEITKMVANSGNQVALHAQTHDRLAYASIKQINKNIKLGKETIKEATGAYPTFMRPPYGSVDGSVFDALAENDLGIGLWSIDTVDWSQPGVKSIVNRAVRYAYPGVVILMHDGGGNREQTVKALPKIIKAYKKAGYRFVTLDEYAKLMNS